MVQTLKLRLCFDLGTSWTKPCITGQRYKDPGHTDPEQEICFLEWPGKSEGSPYGSEVI